MAPKAASPNCPKDSSCKRSADPPNGLSDSLLVLDERKPNVPLTVSAEAAAWADRDVRFAKEAEGELLRRLAARDARPHEHRCPRTRNVPTDAAEAVAQRSPPPAVDGRSLGRPVARRAQGDGRGNLERLEAPVGEVRLQTSERADDIG